MQLLFIFLQMPPHVTHLPGLHCLLLLRLHLHSFAVCLQVFPHHAVVAGEGAELPLQLTANLLQVGHALSFKPCFFGLTSLLHGAPTILQAIICAVVRHQLLFMPQLPLVLFHLSLSLELGQLVD